MTTAELIHKKFKELLGNSYEGDEIVELKDFQKLCNSSIDYNFIDGIKKGEGRQVIVYTLLKVIDDLNRP